MFKRFFSVFLSVVILATMVAGLDFSAKASDIEYGKLTTQAVDTIVNDLVGNMPEKQRLEYEQTLSNLNATDEFTPDQIKVVNNVVDAMSNRWAAITKFMPDFIVDSEVAKSTAASLNYLQKSCDFLNSIFYVTQNGNINNIERAYVLLNALEQASIIKGPIVQSIKVIGSTLKIADVLNTAYRDERVNMYENQLIVEYYDGGVLSNPDNAMMKGNYIINDPVERQKMDALYFKYLMIQMSDLARQECNLKPVNDDGVSGYCGANMSWKYKSSVLTITGSGEMFEYGSSNFPWKEYEDDIITVNMSYGIKTIAPYAFYDCSWLHHLQMPSSLTKIGNYAFYNCKALQYLDTLVIPDGVEEIGNSAFEYCEKIESLSLPSTLEKIGNYSFAYCRTLTEIKIPNGVKEIGNSAFYGSDYVTSIIIGNNVEKIGPSAFGKTRISSISIPSSVKEIDDFAFCYTRLESIFIPSTVEKLGKSICKDSGMLSSMSVSSYNPNYDSRNGCNAIIEKSTNNLIAGCRSTVIPNSVDGIGDSAFYGAVLRSITLPSSITHIDNNAFYDCDLLSSISIPSNVERIGNSAFRGCKSLTSVFLPNSVKSVGANAFVDVDKLTKITVSNPQCELEYSTSKFGFLTITTRAVSSSVSIYACTNSLANEYCQKAKNPFVANDTYTRQKIAPSCTDNGYDNYACQKCNYSYQTNIVDKLGHKYDFVSQDGDNLNYTCIRNDSDISYPANDVLSSWDNSYLNARGNDINERTSLFDVVNDGIINAKDYAFLYNMSR